MTNAVSTQRQVEDRNMQKKGGVNMSIASAEGSQRDKDIDGPFHPQVLSMQYTYRHHMDEIFNVCSILV